MDTTKKPIWPHSNVCTLTAHPSGSWCKKIDGKLKYFGPIRKPDLALRKFIAFQDARLNDYAEREVFEKSTIPLDDVMNRFLLERRSAVTSGELSAGQYARYRRITTHVFDTLGRDRAFASLGPQDMAILRKSLTGGAVSVKNKITWIRTIFHWAEEFYGIKVAYGGMFDKPSRHAMAQGSKKRELFTPVEIRKLLRKASGPMRCFILLGINCGFGQGDIATLPAASVDLRKKLILHARGKTSIRRINPLWKETVAAMKAYQRPNQMRAELFFITKYGRPWVREPVTLDTAGIVKSTSYIDAIGQELDKTCDAAKVKRRGFYTLRHTFRSVADEVADTTAIECLMGHLKFGMGGVYTQLMAGGKSRLLAVINHVYAWLWN